MSNANVDLAAIVKGLVVEARKEYLKSGDLTVEFHTRSDIVVRRSKNFFSNFRNVILRMIFI